MLGIASGGSSSVGRAAAFQAACREFEPRLPLHTAHLNHRWGTARRPTNSLTDTSLGACPPRFRRVGDPDQLGVERTDQLRAFGLWGLRLSERNRQVAGHD